MSINTISGINNAVMKSRLIPSKEIIRMSELLIYLSEDEITDCINQSFESFNIEAFKSLQPTLLSNVSVIHSHGCNKISDDEIFYIYYYVRPFFEHNPAVTEMIKFTNKFDVTSFGELKVSNKTNIIDLKSTFGISEFRNKIISGTGGSATSIPGTDSEIKITLDTSSTAFYKLYSRAQGVYVAGTMSDASLGLRIPDTSVITGDRYVCWGYFNDNDGYGYRYDSTGFSVFIRKGGVETLINSSDFNINNDLTNINRMGKSFNLDEGHIFTIEFVWYGYGIVIFTVIEEGHTYEFHRYQATHGTSSNNPNLPLSVEVNNGGSTNDNPIDVYVGGRQFSIHGNYTPMVRLTPIIELTKTVTATNLGSVDNYTPIFSIRKKSEYQSIPIFLESVDISTDTDIILTIFFDSQLDDPIFGNINLISSTETSLEVDNNSEVITSFSGVILYSAIIISGTGHKTSLSTLKELNKIDFYSNEIVTIAAKSLNGSASINCIVNIEEEF